MRIRQITAALFCAVLALWATASGSSAAPGPIKAVATIFPLADIVRQVGGSRVTVTTLLPAGASPHYFEPTPLQMKLVADAALYVRVGAGLDAWGDRLIAAAKKPPLTVTATSGVKLLPVAEQELLREKGREEHHHEGDDPHVWLDPLIVRDSILPAVTDALVRVSPGDATYFRNNGSRFARELTGLDKEMRKALQALPGKDFIALHSAWAYLARRYGLRQVAAVETFPGKEPSARYIAALVTLARKEGIRTIFAEPQLSDKAARVIAAEIRGRVLLLDPNGGEGVAGRNSYLALMRYNLSVIERGMR